MKKEDYKKETLEKLFTFNNYKLYCKKNNKKEGNYSTLRSFKNYCLYLSYK